MLQKLEGCNYPMLCPHICPMQALPAGSALLQTKKTLQLFQGLQQHMGGLPDQHDPQITAVLTAMLQGSLYPPR